MRRAGTGARGALLLIGMVLISAGCAFRGEREQARTNQDSSFAAVAFERGRAPEKVVLAFGRRLYSRYCSICHGETGGGDGFNAYNVRSTYGVDPTAFSDSASFASLQPDSALRAIRDGGSAIGESPAMPPWGHTLTAGEIAELWAYIQSLHRAPPGG